MLLAGEVGGMFMGALCVFIDDGSIFIPTKKLRCFSVADVYYITVVLLTLTNLT